jgi:predicted RNase H-like HicB family nuclease
MTIRSEVVAANPFIETTIQAEIENCGATCGYVVRSGSKIVSQGESYHDAVANADKAVKVSKENNNIATRMSQDGKVEVQTEAPFRKYVKIKPDITSEVANRIAEIVAATRKSLENCP